MRNLSLIVLFSAFGGLLACRDSSSQTQDPQIEASPEAAPPPTGDAGPVVEVQLPPNTYDGVAESLRQLEQLLRDEFAGSISPLTELPELPQGFLPEFPQEFQPEMLPRGNWMNCTGYLTNNASAGFCEDAPPASWSPFMFNGQRYFLVPLGPSA